MNKNFTLKGDKKFAEKKMKPKNKTLSFLKNFARVYYADDKLSPDLNASILN